MIKVSNGPVLVTVLVAVIGLIFYFESFRPERKATSGAEITVQDKNGKAGRYESARELVGVQKFINSEPLRISDLIGKKIILVDFWTYSCINCQRTTPYLNAWWDAYADDGLVIIGVHTPEFEFEKEYENVLRATENLSIKYPVVQDNDYATWSAYGNRYWPRKYLIDIDGFIVYDHIGEGGYDETEEKIRELLAERKMVLGEPGQIDPNMIRPEGDQAISTKSSSPEIYFGALRNEFLANGQISKVGTQNLSAPAKIDKNKLYLAGTWNIQSEYARNDTSEAKVIFKFEAQEVNMVARSDSPVNIRVFLDGEELLKFEVQESRLYGIIKLPESGEHTLELIFDQAGTEVYTFTFG